MTDTIENGVTFDRSYWPECGTVIPDVLPTDLNDLWDKYSDQVTVLVAEAIISDPPRVYFNGGCVQVYVWSVGGDTLGARHPLSDLINEFANNYYVVCSQAQADEVLGQIAELEKVEAAIAAAKDRMRGLVQAWGQSCG